MKVVIFLIVLFIPFTTLSENPYKERRLLPKVETQEIDGVPYKCLDTKQWQSVLLLAQDYQGLFDWRLEIQGTLAAHTQVVEAYELKISNYEVIIKIKDADIKFLNTHIEQLEKAQRRKTIEERLEKYALWAVVLIETVTIGILGVKSWDRSN